MGSQIAKNIIYMGVIRQLKYKSERNNRKNNSGGKIFFLQAKNAATADTNTLDLKIGEEDWTCLKCSKHHDRDLNVSINIKK